MNEFTRDAIKNANAKAQEKAIASVLPNFDKLGKSLKILPKDGPDSLELFPAYDAQGNEVGTAVKTYTNKGFSGHFTVMVGFKPDGTISGYEVLQHQETPGLGSKMGQWFRNKDKPKQDIIGKNPGKVNFHVSKRRWRYRCHYGGHHFITRISGCCTQSLQHLEKRIGCNDWFNHEKRRSNERR